MSLSKEYYHLLVREKCHPEPVEGGSRTENLPSVLKHSDRLLQNDKSKPIAINEILGKYEKLFLFNNNIFINNFFTCPNQL